MRLVTGETAEHFINRRVAEGCNLNDLAIECALFFGMPDAPDSREPIGLIHAGPSRKAEHATVFGKRVEIGR